MFGGAGWHSLLEAEAFYLSYMGGNSIAISNSSAKPDAGGEDRSGVCKTLPGNASSDTNGPRPDGTVPGSTHSFFAETGLRIP